MAGRREKSKPRTRCDWLETEMQADRAEGGKVLVKTQKRRRSSADTPEHRRYVDLASQNSTTIISKNRNCLYLEPCSG